MRRVVKGFSERPMQQKVVTALVCLGVLVGAVVGTLALTSASAPGGAHQQALALAPPATSTPGTAAGTPTAPVSPAISPTTRATPRAHSPSPSPTPRPVPSPVSPPPISFNTSLVVDQGQQGVQLAVTTAPTIGCTLTLGYQGAPGPISATSNQAGSVTFVWNVASNAAPGRSQFQVACGTSSAQGTIRIRADQ